MNSDVGWEIMSASQAGKIYAEMNVARTSLARPTFNGDSAALHRNGVPVVVVSALSKFYTSPVSRNFVSRRVFLKRQAPRRGLMLTYARETLSFHWSLAPLQPVFPPPSIISAGDFPDGTTIHAERSFHFDSFLDLLDVRARVDTPSRADVGIHFDLFEKKKNSGIRFASDRSCALRRHPPDGRAGA